MVKNAAGLADYTIVTIHAHEGGKDRFLPADFLVTFARAMVDAGADLFVGHGPHVLRGIELYKGQADHVQPRRLYFPERDPAAAAQ